MTSTPNPVAPRNNTAVEDQSYTLPPEPQDTSSTWATVVGKAVKRPIPPMVQVPRRPTPTSRPNTQTTSKEDKSLFLRLGRDHHWHKLSPVTIKKIITDKAGKAGSAMTSMYPVNLGIALEYASDALRDTMMRIVPSLQKDNTVIEAASKWTLWIVTHILL